MKLLTLPIADIQRNPHQPRVSFDESALEELASSIASVGLLHPPLVHEQAPGDYILIAGERRLQACRRLGLTKIDVWVIGSSSARHRAEAALVENLQRVDLDAMEIAHSLHRLRVEFDYSHEAIAQAIGKKRSSVSNYLRLLQLEPSLQDALRAGWISFGHGKLLAAHPPKTQAQWLKKILDQHLSVHEVEKQLQALSAKKVASPVKKRAPIEWEELCEAIVKRYGLKADIRLRSKKKGSLGGCLKLYFSKPEDLHRLAYGRLEEF